jgi:peptidoglycan glycosyltransferase
MSRRLGILGVILLALFLVLAGQSAYLQYWRAPALDASVLNPRVGAASRLAPRGEILAANGKVLAESIAAPGNYEFPWRRVYPLGSLTAGVVGFNSNYYGTWGLEAKYSSLMTAHQQTPESAAQLLAPTTSADSITLTLQPSLQQVAKTALAGRDGAVVALNPTNGNVLAMYSNPTYNPNLITAGTYAAEKKAWSEYTTPDPHRFEPLDNVATQETFPPGSTSKIVTTAATVKYQPLLLTMAFPSNVCITLPNGNPLQPLCNDGYTSCGGTVAVMLPESCDPGYALLGLALGGTDLADQARLFGYDHANPLDLPSYMKTTSFFPTAKTLNNNLPFLAYSAIGQGNVRTTALQNALVASAIADHGVIMTPHLLATITNAQGVTVSQYQPKPWQTPLDPSEAAQIVPLMEDVVTEGTAAYVGFLPADDVAAKTGTAQTGGRPELTDDWMIAFAPATHPVVAIAVIVPFQTVFTTGAIAAGPVMKCMIEAALALHNGLPVANTATTCPS